MAMDTQDVWLDGRPTRVRTAGAPGAPPLLCIHGNTVDGGDWQAVLPGLSGGSRVIAADLPGFGPWDALPASYSPGAMARFLGALLDRFGLASATILGHSFGGRAALDFALAQPGRVGRLVLVVAAGLGPEIDLGSVVQSYPVVGEWATFASTWPPSWPLRLAFRMRHLFADPGRAPSWWIADQGRLAALPQTYWASLAAARAQVGPAGQSVVHVDRLGELPMPTLVLWGDSDRVVPASQAIEAAGRLPRGRAVVFPECGHVPHVEWPDRFVAEVQTFLRRPAGRRRRVA
jgi:4,5:9,10-diseco-3-hydroxy-5,9,17-trioxoandrosta-1(10),2-diene-4-oate hydrolase